MAFGKRTLIGCAAGCGAALLVAVLAAIAFGTWLSRPRELLEPERLIGPRTTGYLEWTLELDNPGTAGFVELLIELIHTTSEDPEGPFPPWINDWLRRKQRASVEHDLHELFPLVVAWVRDDRGNGGSGSELVTLSLESVGNQLVLLDLVLGWLLGHAERSTAVRYRDEQIFGFPWGDDRSLTAFIRGNDLFFVADTAAARDAIDRLIVARDAAGDPTELDTLFSTTAGGAEPLRGALINSNDALSGIGRSLGLDPDWLRPWCTADALRVTGGLRADGALRGTLVASADEAWVAENTERLSRSLELGLAEVGLESTVAARTDGGDLSLDVEIRDLLGWLKRLDE